MLIHDYPLPPQIATPRPLERASSQSLPRFSDDLLREGQLLLKLGIGKPTIARMMLRAQQTGCTVEAELLASGEIVDTLYFEALANRLGLPFLAQIDAERVHDADHLDRQLVAPEMLRLYSADRPPVTVIAPPLAQLDEIAAALARTPRLVPVLAVAAPRTLRAAAWACGRRRRVRTAVGSLFDTDPLHSARIVFWGRQGFYTGLGLSLFALLAVLAPLVWLTAIHIVLTSLYASQLFLRVQALRHVRQTVPARVPPPIRCDGPLPVYSVFVALYREAAVVAQLIGALDRLDWPRSRLDIKLICEEDDRDTIAALRALPLGAEYEIVPVPVTSPRTKPKALTYCLPGARGTYLVIYDAEDRPDPGQLREAHAAFLVAEPDVACLQSPLIITNAHQSWLSAMFALEYSGLFRGLLPFLASAGLPLPLGGTSNHFRVETLKALGGWDPYNTTEDADLGLRLHRLGYRSKMIGRPTLEDAPIHAAEWFGQRTRWYKGWLQTWLVLMRDPLLLFRQTGWRAFAALQILSAGMIVSALGHPLSLALIVYLGCALVTSDLSTERTLLATILLLLDCVNIAGSYAIMIRLGCKTMTPRERKAVGRRWLAIPIYWLLISGAAWAAVVELYRAPFAWNKTPHRPIAL